MVWLLAFVLVAGTALGLIHYYVWRRLVRDTTRPGRWRRVGAVVVAVLALLVPVALFAGRTVHWLSWPGYLWFGLMIYLCLALVLLELPMLVARRVVGRRMAPGRASRGREPSTGRAVPGPRVPSEQVPSGVAHSQSRAGAEPAAANAKPAADISPTDKAATDGPAGPGTGTGDLDRRRLLARGAAIVAGLTAASVTGYGVRTALGPPTLKRVSIPLTRLDRRADGYRIALVSDIHIGPMRGRSHTERIVEMINALDADVVAVTGDLVDGSVAEFGRAAEPLRQLRARQGAFFVTGNHEYYSGHEEWLAEVDRLGVRPLRNQRVEMAAFDLAGVNDLTGEEHGDGPDLDRALAGRDTTRPVVLLAHQPAQVHEAARHGVDLQLSGHTHGGQMFPNHLLVRLEQPMRSGLGTVDGTALYVTNGAGFWGPPLRVGAPPAIAVVELRSR